MHDAPLLLTWSDRAPERRPAHHGSRPAGDQGPIRRLLAESPVRYGAVWLLATPENARATESLAEELRQGVAQVRVWTLPVADPSDYEQLFVAVGTVLPALPGGSIDVLLSAGTPQAQATWLLLVKAELLHARMLKVVPAAFVPVPHPHAVAEVRLDFAGFPEIRALREEVGRLRARVAPHGLVGESLPMRALRDRMAAVARSDVPVVVHGETGTGKELVARALHADGPRAGGPWVAENCAAFAEGVLQSELFGHERGAFTGAAGRRRGLFELADGGTLLLDEVAEMPLATQASLLRVLQDGALRRVGGERPIKVDVRVVVATHRDLAQRVREGTFREDLYYRLRGATLDVPPLRARAGDLELLVEHFLAGRPLAPTPAAWKALRAWTWPGNVRELRAEVLRWTVFCQERVSLADLAPELRGHENAEAPSPAESAVRTLAEVVAEAERSAISAALAAAEGNLSRTARALGIDRNTLKRKLRGS
jgi:DNA-binding NtrC family response regulator